MKRYIVIAALFVIVGASCASDSTTVTETDAPTATAGTSDEAPGVHGDRIVVVGHDDLSFEPEELTVEAGTYTFIFRNEGKTVHQFALSSEEGHDQHVGDTGEIDGGQTATFEATLEEGTYEMACHLPGHFEGGMHGTITVTG